MTRQRHTSPNTDHALAQLNALPTDRPAILLHSGRYHPQWATHSILAKPVAWFRYLANNKSQLINLDRPLTHNLWHDLRSLLNDPTLPGKWFGYISYDIARLIEPVKLTNYPNDDRNWPIVQLAYCPDNNITFLQTPEIALQHTPPPPDRQFHVTNPVSPFTPRQYEAAVQRCIDYIAAGDVFQVCLTQRFSSQFTGSPRDLFTRLATLSPAWFGSYIELPDNRHLCSTSPELFLEMKNRHITTRPIKGTRPASVHPNVLRDSPKDTAELNMIIDLLRNDLGRVCDYSTVRVPQPRTIETHPTIHHTTATITGQLHHSKDTVDLLKATLPGGSITGAPKIRAMQIINELKPTTRGPYTGCIGYISKDSLALNIAIRTILLTPKPNSPANTYTLDFSVGGGIVADSNPHDEYIETIDKAQAILKTLNTTIT